ncbi:hypothetical protein HPT29_017255 [Microvirga terrae]|uniref:Terminase small subunit n=1 Tax=Microvirga terrae TaxID=2740529 RepID=A0ABY5RQJ3_9HYPH|nr:MULTISPECIES: hypothetical protein [Microvirga]MBQ0822298.1 hypothetical protein [Microvirga sp. HBU67558]UVF18249.1 hypothetical protein HPT29_017255 [Microvirga terrae]
MGQRIDISDEQKQQAWEIYARQPDKHLPDIQAFLGISSSSFARKRDLWGWPPRYAALNENALSKAAKDQGGIAGLHKAATASVNDAARALAQATRAQIDTLMDEQRTGRAKDHDRTARRLAAYARTLAAARALLQQEGSSLDVTEPRDQPRRSLHELRDELAHHLDRVIAEEEARGRDGILV